MYRGSDYYLTEAIAYGKYKYQDQYTWPWEDGDEILSKWIVHNLKPSEHLQEWK
jgi:hypothetical protein